MNRLRCCLLLSVLPLALALAACKPAPEPAVDDARPTPQGAAGNITKPAAEGDVPVLEVETLDGERFDLAAQRGQWVVVNYWATWCGPCIEEMPELSALDAMREHVRVVGLAYDDADADTLREFLGKHPVVYPVAKLDPQSPPADFGHAAALPMTWLIDPQGRLVRKFVGPVTARLLEEAIAAAGGPEAGA
ncbi:TlpA family protein disulfide reductase [Luteimonas sp. e5]